MDLLTKLSKQANELWQKQATCKDQIERALLLRQYKEKYGQYLKHKEWLKMMAI